MAHSGLDAHCASFSKSSLLSPHMHNLHQALLPSRGLAVAWPSAHKLPPASAPQQAPAGRHALSAAAPRAQGGADGLADNRICDSDDPFGRAPAPVFLGGRAGRRPRFDFLNRAAAVKQQSQQQRLATTPQPPPAAPKPPFSARDVVIAVDDTDDALQAVEWAAVNVLKGGDVLHLLHVLRDNRTNETDVGELSRSGYTWATPDYASRQAWVARLTEQAEAMIDRRFVPSLRRSGVRYQVNLLRQRGTFSAAGIGEQICQFTAELNASLMLVASHGKGVLAEFGSVAKYCQEHSQAPVLMLPPNVAQQNNTVPGRLVVAAFEDLAAVQRAAAFTALNVYRTGDSVCVLYILDEGAVEASGCGRESLLEAAAAEAEAVVQRVFQEELGVAVPLEVDALQPSGPMETVDVDAGTSICEMAEDLNARTVVLLSRSSRNPVQNMLFESANTYCVRNCKSPLLVLR